VPLASPRQPIPWPTLLKDNFFVRYSRQWWFVAADAAPRKVAAKTVRRKPTMFATIEPGLLLTTTTLSPMTLSDRLITLAKDADTAGYAATAEQLVQLAMTVFDEAPRRRA
jgi:hypothetical protein